jgi:hypothetical protein
MEIVGKQLGPVALDLSLKDGALVGEVKLPVVELLDLGAAKVKAAIPGQIDDAVIDVVVAALKAELLKP